MNRPNDTPESTSARRANISELDRDDLIDLACDTLDATRYAGDTLFAFVDEENPGFAYMHTAEDLVALGTRIARGDDDIYACWTHDNLGIEIDPSVVARNLFAAGTRNLDPAQLRAEAASAGDFETVAAMDHIEDEVAESLAALWARWDSEVAR